MKVSLAAFFIGAACSMDLMGDRYEIFVQKELQKRAAAARKEVGMQAKAVAPARDCCCVACAADAQTRGRHHSCIYTDQYTDQ